MKKLISTPAIESKLHQTLDTLKIELKPQTAIIYFPNNLESLAPNNRELIGGITEALLTSDLLDNYLSKNFYLIPTPTSTSYEIGDLITEKLKEAKVIRFGTIQILQIPKFKKYQSEDTLDKYLEESHKILQKRLSTSKPNDILIIIGEPEFGETISALTQKHTEDAVRIFQTIGNKTYTMFQPMIVTS